MALRIYDTRQRSKVELEPIEPGLVKMYTCGPTVYRDAHIGNFRTFIFEDLLRRTLKFLGFRVIQVMNLTDVDDRTIKEARNSGKPLEEVTTPVTERFFRELDLLKIERAEHYPLATRHIPQMVEMIAVLLNKGFAYKMGNSVYFSIAKFPDYGRLSGMNLDNLARGVRIDADDYEKDDFRDFALWKGWTEADGDVGWDSPFGRGRPGWHIECSAMSRAYLGDEFDLHTGGVDNIFPHHENEIAQSVAATGRRFALHWMHSAHLRIEGEKMSKSLGNVFIPRAVYQQGYDPRVVRYVLLTTHYRQPLNFSYDALDAASAALERLDTLPLLAGQASREGGVRRELERVLAESAARFTAALENDLAISGALAAMFDLVSAVHRLNRDAALNAAEGEAVKGLWLRFDSVLGFLTTAEEGIDAEVEQLVRERYRLRQQRQFPAADGIRTQLAGKGYQLEDTATGTVVVWKGGRKMIPTGD